MKVTITGNKEAIENFVNDMGLWKTIFNKFHCTIERSSVDDNTVVFAFGLGAHPWFPEFKSKEESEPRELLEKECENRNLKLK